MEQFTKKDFPLISDYILSEYERRKNHSRRVTFDKVVKEIDRQIAMVPDISHKLDSQGNPDPQKTWLPETELPLQAQTLEVLTSDARRMIFPDSGPWFAAHSATTDEYLDFMETQSIITGDEVDVPSLITQDNVDKLVQGAINHWHRQYNFHDIIDVINAESFSYGCGIGRGRLVSKSVFINTAKGTIKGKKKMPVLYPVSIKNTYLDDRGFSLMGEGHILGPAQIFKKTQSLQDLKVAAKKGSKDQSDEDGGWIPNALRGLEGDKKGNITLIEWEGDLAVPRKGSGTIYMSNTIVTIVMGQRGKESSHNIVRLRFKKNPYSSYIEFPYHREGIDDIYCTSPLVKGWPIQKAAVEALNNLFITSALNALPPIGYNRDDTYFSKGLSVHPGAKWGTTDEVKVHNFGDPGALFNIYIGLLQQYSDVTGVNAPRLGAQTVSHTTAFAKDAELNRGIVRTVDYVRSLLKNPLTQWLDMEYKMGRETLDKEDIYIDAYSAFVTISKRHLPEKVEFDVHGAGGPAEEQAKKQNKLNSLQIALQMDQLGIQLGRQPRVNLAGAIDETLREGGWIDLDVITNTDGVPEGTEGGSSLEGDTGGIEAAPGAALQALGQQGIQ